MNNRIVQILAIVILITLLFFPYFKVSENAPGFEVLDLLIPVLLFHFILKFKQIPEKKVYYFIAGFGAYIFLTIAVNGRLGNIRDYFEIFKMIKFALVISLFSFVPVKDFFNKWIKPVFIALVVFNLIHYFELFGLNGFLEKYYQAGERMSSFGRNSIGLPDYKRMLGFACNPNYNAIIFLFFTVVFIPKTRTKITKAELIYFFVALLMVFMCQSRTALLAVVCLMLVYAIILAKKEMKKFGVVLLLTILAFGMATIVSKLSIYTSSGRFDAEGNKIIYVDSLGVEISVDSLNQVTYMETMVNGSAFDSYSLNHRIEVWNHLKDMIMKKPILGHGPYKEYFYNNKLYSESEYFMITWRYGFVGLIYFLLFFIIPCRVAAKHLNSDIGMVLLLFTVVLAISSSTNNPFSHKTILVLYGITIGLFLNYKKSLDNSKEKKNTE